MKFVYLIALFVLQLARAQQSFVLSSPGPSLIQQKTVAEEKCKKLFGHIACANGIYLVGGAGMIGGIGGQVTWINIGIKLTAGISFINLLEVGVEGEGIVYPLVYQTYTHGFYAKFRPFNGFFIGGRYYKEPAGYFQNQYYLSNTYAVEIGIDGWQNFTKKTSARGEIYLSYNKSENGESGLQMGVRFSGLVRLFGKHKENVKNKMMEKFEEMNEMQGQDEVYID